MNFIIKYLKQNNARHKIALTSKQQKSATSEFVTLTCFDFQYRECLLSILKIRFDLWPQSFLFSFFSMKIKIKMLALLVSGCIRFESRYSLRFIISEHFIKKYCPKKMDLCHFSTQY